MSIDIPQTLRNLVTAKFSQAQTSQDLIFSKTELAVLPNKSGSLFQLRYCPSLAKKPTDNKSFDIKSQDNKGKNSLPKKPKFDPFENPSESLLVTSIPSHNPTHNIVLNKFPIIHDHFILATKENKAQTDLLEVDDLWLTYQCIRSWSVEDEQKIPSSNTATDTSTTNKDEEPRFSLFAFFNSGEHSGASQPHRHIQFLPIEAMARGSEDENPNLSPKWQPIIDEMIPAELRSEPNSNTTSTQTQAKIYSNPPIPISHFAVRLDKTMNPQDLYDRYIILLKRAHLAITTSPTDSNADIPMPIIPSTKKVSFSYNLAMTKSTMAILPRRSEIARIKLPNQVPSNDKTTREENDESTVAINGTILAGTLMVKYQNQWQGLKSEPEELDNLLRLIGFPSSSSDSADVVGGGGGENENGNRRDNKNGGDEKVKGERKATTSESRVKKVVTSTL